MAKKVQKVAKAILRESKGIGQWYKERLRGVIRILRESGA